MYARTAREASPERAREPALELVRELELELAREPALELDSAGLRIQASRVRAQKIAVADAIVIMRTKKAFAVVSCLRAGPVPELVHAEGILVRLMPA